MAASGADGKAFSGISADTAGFSLQGGRYVFSATATFGGGNVQVQMLMNDGSTWVAPKDIGGSANNLTAAGSQTIDIPAGQYRVHVVTATAVICALWRVPA